MRIMIRVKPDALINPETNPLMRVFVTPGANGKCLTTAGADNNLRDFCLPPGAIRGKWISGYRFRVAYAVIFKKLGMLDGSQLHMWIREFFGHVESSNQAEEYSRSKGRPRSCKSCRDSDKPSSECACAFIEKRDRSAETKKAKRAEHDKEIRQHKKAKKAQEQMYEEEDIEDDSE